MFWIKINRKIYTQIFFYEDMLRKAFVYEKEKTILVKKLLTKLITNHLFFC